MKSSYDSAQNAPQFTRFIKTTPRTCGVFGNSFTTYSINTISMTDKTQFWLIRHGETAWNAKQRLQGWVDIPLNDAGRQQAENLQRYLQSKQICSLFDTVISSDLGRAKETATIALQHTDLSITQDERLRERSYGIYEGEHWRQLMRPVEQNNGDSNESTASPNLRDPNQEVPEGESLLQFQQRIVLAIEDLARRHQGQSVALFAHGGVIDIVWRQTHGLDLYAQRPRPIQNTSINHFQIQPISALWAPIEWEITEHLQPAE